MPHVDAARVLTRDGVVGPARVVITGDRIVDLVPIATAPDRLLAPGFVDLQVNGVGDIDVATAGPRDWVEIERRLLAAGVTSWCPTLVSRPLDGYRVPLASIERASARPSGCRPHIIGAHLEGPFLGRRPGAHRPDVVVDVDLDWIRALPSVVRLVTLAPENPGATEATRVLVGTGRTVAIGHTEASAEQFDAVVGAGASLVTHLFNAMSGLHHRDPGIAGLALVDDRVACSLIADGVHVDTRVVKMAMAVLGGRAVLVSDSTACSTEDLASGGVDLVDGVPRLADGTLAGSAVLLDESVRRCITAGTPVEAVLRAASTGPASVLGLTDRGEIATGLRADMVVLDPAWQVEQVWIGGERAR